METLEYLGIAFVASALLIMISKIILQALIRRPAGYYLDEEFRQEAMMLEAAGLTPFDEHETDTEGVNLEGETIIEEVAEAEDHHKEKEKEKEKDKDKDKDKDKEHPGIRHLRDRHRTDKG